MAKKSVDLSSLDKIIVKGPSENTSGINVTNASKEENKTGDRKEKEVEKSVNETASSTAASPETAGEVEPNEFGGLKDFLEGNQKFNKSDRTNVPIYTYNHEKLDMAVTAIEKEFGQKIGITGLTNNIIDFFFKAHKKELERLHKKHMKNIEF